MIFIALIIFIIIAYIVANRTIRGLFTGGNTFLILTTAACGTQAVKGGFAIVRSMLNGDMLTMQIGAVFLSLWVLATVYWYKFKKYSFIESLKYGVYAVVGGVFWLLIIIGVIKRIVIYLLSLL